MGGGGWSGDLIQPPPVFNKKQPISFVGKRPGNKEPPCLARCKLTTTRSPMTKRKSNMFVFLLNLTLDKLNLWRVGGGSGDLTRVALFAIETLSWGSFVNKLLPACKLTIHKRKRGLGIIWRIQGNVHWDRNVKQKRPEVSESQSRTKRHV